MPEKVTSLNGVKVTSEYCSHTIDAYNKDYVKQFIFYKYNQLVINEA